MIEGEGKKKIMFAKWGRRADGEGPAEAWFPVRRFTIPGTCPDKATSRSSGLLPVSRRPCWKGSRKSLDGLVLNQLGDGFAAWSITKSSTGPLARSNLSPSSGIKRRKESEGSL